MHLAVSQNCARSGPRAEAWVRTMSKRAPIEDVTRTLVVGGAAALLAYLAYRKLRGSPALVESAGSGSCDAHHDAKEDPAPCTTLESKANADRASRAAAPESRPAAGAEVATPSSRTHAGAMLESPRFVVGSGGQGVVSASTRRRQSALASDGADIDILSYCGPSRTRYVHECGGRDHGLASHVANQHMKQ